MNNQLTQKDIDRMQEEIDHRKLVLRPQLLEEVKETRAHGDLSENFEYHAAKRAKNQNESRIRFLERMIRTARVIEDTAGEDEAGINKAVTVYIPEDDEEETYTLVSTIREDSLNNLVSVESPIGKALLHHKAGDKVQVRVKNTGVRQGMETIQVYIRRMADKEGPAKTLRAYKQVELKPGEQQMVSIALPRQSFEGWDATTNTMRVVPGKYDVMVGTSSNDNDLQHIAVTIK